VIVSSGLLGVFLRGAAIGPLVDRILCREEVARRRNAQAVSAVSSIEVQRAVGIAKGRDRPARR